MITAYFFSNDLFNNFLAVFEEYEHELIMNEKKNPYNIKSILFFVLFIDEHAVYR